MRITHLRCDGCERTPTFWEWCRGELTARGYPEWAHPAIAFKDAGLPLTPENRAVYEQLFTTLFNHPAPDDWSYFCPDCGERVRAEVPELASEFGLKLVAA
jgi:hypothetical protein